MQEREIVFWNFLWKTTYKKQALFLLRVFRWPIFFKLPNTKRCGKLSLQKVFHRNKQRNGRIFFLFFRSFGSIEWENRHQIWNLYERLRGKATSLSKKCHFQKVNGWQANINQQPIISQSLEWDWGADAVGIQMYYILFDFMYQGQFCNFLIFWNGLC